MSKVYKKCVYPGVSKNIIHACTCPNYHPHCPSKLLKNYSDKPK